MQRQTLATVILVLLLPLPVVAQTERYEVGQRLVAFDKAWEQHRQDAAAKKRTLKTLLQVVPSLLTGQWYEGAQLLDKTRAALTSGAEPSAALQWADSLYLQPATRLMPKKADRLIVVLRRFYKTDLKIPENAKLVVEFHDRDKVLLPPVTAAISELPCALNLPAALPEGDHFLRSRIEVAGKTLATEEQLISVVDRLPERLAALKNGLSALPEKANNTDVDTARYLASLLEALARGATEETNYPAARLLAEAEAALKTIQAGKSYYGHGKTGQFWLKLATLKGAYYTRLFAPAQAQAGKPLPLVVALHGAGTSENMFFESYGNGLIVQLCKERGWLLVSPRANGYLVFTMPVAAIVGAVAKLYPVDREKVFVVGHSMGAAQAVTAAQQEPKLFAGVAALGGSGKVYAADKIKTVPFFVGVGDSDFALEGARKLAKQLQTGGVATVEAKEYPDVEHIMIVREALPAVFALFDKFAKK